MRTPSHVAVPGATVCAGRATAIVRVAGAGAGAGAT
jgi:hypothetical protein